MVRFVVLFFLLFAAQAQAQFQNSGFAVVLIDMQYGFYERGGVTKSQGLQDLVRNQIRLLNWAVQKHIPVLVFEYNSFRETDSRLMKVIENHPHKVITKYEDNGFGQRSHDEAVQTLKDWHVDSLIVAGINGPYCVEGTIRGAMKAGFDVMTTAWVIGNINYNPPTFPNGSWYFDDHKFVVFPTLDSIIR